MLFRWISRKKEISGMQEILNSLYMKMGKVEGNVYWSFILIKTGCKVQTREMKVEGLNSSCNITNRKWTFLDLRISY